MKKKSVIMVLFAAVAYFIMLSANANAGSGSKDLLIKPPTTEKPAATTPSTKPVQPADLLDQKTPVKTKIDRAVKVPTQTKELPTSVKQDIQRKADEALAELEIVSVEKSDTARVIPNRDFDVHVNVRNTGTGAAEVFAATAGARSSMIVKGPRSVSIMPGRTEMLPLTLKVSPQFMRNNRFKTTVFIAKAHARGTGLLDIMWTDRNRNDNTKEVEFPIAPPDFYDVDVKFEKIDVFDDCDNVSDGDWIVMYSAYVTAGDLVRPAARRSVDNRVWPHNSDGAKEVTTGESYAINGTFHLTVSPESHVRAIMSAIDCDKDSDLTVWGLFEGFSDIMPYGGRCFKEEEITELSGSNDLAGNVQFILSPERWKSGGNFSANSEGGSCGDGAAYKTYIKVSSTPNWE